MKRRREILSYIIILSLILIVAALTACVVAFVLRDEKDEKTVSVVAEDALTETYTMQEVEELLAKEKEDAEAQKEAAAAQARQEVLDTIRENLESGESAVETLRELYEGKIVLVSEGAYRFTDIDESLKMNDYTEDNLIVLENGEFQYMEDGQVISHKGIDVSKFQGDIDWQKVAEDGVEFAFIRVGLRGYGSGKMVEDEYFEENIKGALGAGIKVGVYFFSQAINEEEVLEEAQFVIDSIAPYRIECPVVFDVEMIAGDNGRMDNLTVEERTNLALLFCRTIENAGYTPMIYHNMEMSVLKIDLEQFEEYDKWFAYYNDDFYYPYDYKIWQYSEKGKINGIGTNVDMNISFGPLWDE